MLLVKILFILLLLLLSPILLPALIFSYFYFKLTSTPSIDFFEGLLLGHRGCGIEEIPENTIEALKHAHKNNCDGKKKQNFFTPFFM